MTEKTVSNYNILETNQFISKAIDLAGVGIVITDPEQDDNPIIYVNKGFEEISGYQSEEIMGLNCRFLQDGTATEVERAEIRDKMAAGKPVHIVLKNFKKDGTFFWNELNISKVYIEELKQSFFIGIQKDITKQVTAEKLAEANMLDVRKLSMPIIPIDGDTAVIPVIGGMNEERQQLLLDKVGGYLEKVDKEVIILDLSGIDEYDEYMNWTIYSLDQMVALMGRKLYIAGISPELAMHSLRGNNNLSKIRSFKTVELAVNQMNKEKKA